MRKAPYSSYNPYFLVPFLLWVVTGGILLSLYDQQQLFAAVNGRYTPLMDWLMYYITWMGEGGFIVLMLLVLMGAYVYRTKWYFITAVLCNAVPAMLIQLLKNTFHRPRPINFFQHASWVHFDASWGEPLMHNSFPSGHSAGAFSLFCFLSFLLPAKYRYFGILFLLLALLTCYSRIYLAAHFFADIYAGSVLGTVFTILGFSLMRYLQPRFYKTGNMVSPNQTS